MQLDWRPLYELLDKKLFPKSKSQHNGDDNDGDDNGKFSPSQIAQILIGHFHSESAAPAKTVGKGTKSRRSRADEDEDGKYFET